MKIVFMGTPQAAVASLAKLMESHHDVVAAYTQPDKPAGRGNKLHASSVKEYAIERGLAVYQPAKIRTDEALAEFRSHSADVAVVVAYGRILPETWLNAFPHGAINVHFSLLPKYRGAAPVNWAIANGERETGVTTMMMDVGLDTGNILFGGLDSIEPKLQDHTAASLAPIMKKDDGRIDFSMTAANVNNRVRGFQPFPTAFTYLGGKRLTIWRSSVVIPDELPRAAEEGTIVAAKGDELVIARGEGTFLSVHELQIEGKRRMTTRDFNNGVKPAVGTLLGT
ncbi:MAG: methionyl-tRNA formyltransferase [Acidobacteria bacterium]|nr:methionyl-tRNA formyltransferase [Acidobacteriota bacterium]